MTNVRFSQSAPTTHAPIPTAISSDPIVIIVRSPATTASRPPIGEDTLNANGRKSSTSAMALTEKPNRSSSRIGAIKKLPM